MTATGAPDRSARRSVERLAAAGEAPIRRVAGSSRANPLPHAGTISVFLLGVVTLTGIYITLFYEYGFTASYEAVERMHDHPIQQLMRSIHRYSSAALVLTTLVHAWRIFVAGRFTHGRRWRWLTGLAALGLVWLAGVTGYWLVWDDRAQALAEALVALIGDWGWGAALVVDSLVGTGVGSGAGVMVTVWLLHLALTAVIAWFVWKHLRRSRLGWLPPRPWMIAMGVGLVLVSLLIPADLRPPADPTALIGDMRLDPFVLFLLPPMLSGWAWLSLGALILAGAVAASVPFVLRDRRDAVVTIDPDRCTGCELCVVDCPYLALSMVPVESVAEGITTADNIDRRQRSLAVVDPTACVGCGICVGSCSFGAMEVPGVVGPDTVAGADVAGHPVVVACARHIRTAGTIDDDHVVIEVPCAGTFHARAVGDLVARGATSVQLVGCAPGECAYGVGNVITHERLSGERAPHVSRRDAGVTVEDYVAAGGLRSAVGHPGEHPRVDPADLAVSHRSRVGAGALVGLSLLGVGLLTLAPFGGEPADASVRVVVDHRPGTQLIGQLEASGTPGEPTVVVVRVDGIEQTRTAVPVSGGRSVGVVDVEVDPGDAELAIVLDEGTGAETILYEGPARFAEGRRFFVEARDVPPAPGVSEGRKVFGEPRLGACGICHSLEAGDDGVGPSLAGVGTRAASRVPGLTAEEYLRQSILEPDAFVVEGYRAGQMLPIYDERLTGAQIESLVAYLLSLEDAS